MNALQQFGSTFLTTVRDVIPITVVVIVFQLAVLKRRMPNLGKVLLGSASVLLGLSTFLIGLEMALFPLGEAMAAQLASPAFLVPGGVAADLADLPWHAYGWTYLFAFCIGFSATIAEPALLAVAIKASQVSGGTIHVWGLRAAVALGSGCGVALGTWRIVMGIPLPYLILGGYAVVLVQTAFAPRAIVPLAYDSGGVTTSTVTVPLVAALGLGLATHLPGRDPLVDGFGMIALAVLFPMMTVMGYAQLARWWGARPARRDAIPKTDAASSAPA